MPVAWRPRGFTKPAMWATLWELERSPSRAFGLPLLPAFE